MPAMEPAPRPTQREREDAGRFLDLALAEGQITTEEHLARLARVVEATESSQIERVLADLQPAAPIPPTWLQRAGEAWANTPGREKTAYAVTAALIIGLTLFAVAQPDAERADESSYAVIAQDQTSVERISAFAEAYEKKFGTTKTGGVQLDEVVAQALVPVDGDNRRYETWYLQNDAFNHYGARRSGKPQVDLAEVDHEAAAENLDRAWGQLGVDKPATVTIIISGPHSSADRATISYIVSNEFQESGRLVTALDGEELSRTPFDPMTPNR